MGRMPELDFIDYIESKPLTPEDIAEISECIRKDRAGRVNVRTAREKLEAKALALPSSERTQLAYQLLSSLAAEEEEIDESQRQWASTAKAEFEQLHSSRQPIKAGKKPTRRTKSART